MKTSAVMDAPAAAQADVKATALARLADQWPQVQAARIQADLLQARILQEAYVRKIEQSTPVTQDGRVRKIEQRDLASVVGLSVSTINIWLLYARFHQHTGLEVPFTRFWAYWQAHQLPSTRAGKHDRTYEHNIFTLIVRAIEAGTPPATRVRQLRQRLKDRAAERGPNPYRTLHKEVTQHYKTHIEPKLHELKRLLHADRSSYAPVLLADAATLLERELTTLFSMFTLPHE